MEKYISEKILYTNMKGEKNSYVNVKNFNRFQI